MSSGIGIVVTEVEYKKAEAAFQNAAKNGFECVSAPDEEIGLSAAVSEHGARHAIVGVSKYSDKLYDALAKGSVIARFGVGYDGLDMARATEIGVLCTNTPGVLDDSVAEHTVALMLAVARHVPVLVENTRIGSWKAIVGSELRGKTLAIIGCGPIGCRVAQITALGFGMRVIGCEIRSIDIEKMKQDYGFYDIVADFAEAVSDADFVSLQIPSIPQTRHFINSERLAEIPENAWLINTARGAVVDEDALHAALKSGKLAGAALDVFESEPYVPLTPEKDLRKLPNVIMTPHVASSTQEACNRMAEGALRNIALAECGEYDAMDLLNPEVLKKL